ncbi:hypothetical protein EDB81DRAFT_693071 [Dactylonectria macrodidyma]|uniref:Zn(2)-C6 fungal-type domain-containing protein n=1 Tax=Dactylonectria macrodidyma TaxID=307937 RepID=A0A9P9EIM2_9HYPO|nr:hypothetical protein EDB81DRAFT_693071 [Dactylonectria macrodidyma]
MEADMQDLPDSPPTPRSSGTSRRRTRTRTTKACSACRARRTRCDSRKPDCGFCLARGLKCHYEQSEQPPTSRVEMELAAINQRLDYITSILPSTPLPSVTPGLILDRIPENHVFTGEEKLPFQLLGTECMMSILGLGPGFAQELVTLERNTTPVGVNGSSRVRLIQREQALSALAAFSTHIHVWYPILRPRFSERYLSIISGPLPPGSETCMVLLVAALGILAQQDHELGVSPCDNSSELYLEAAMASLPAVLIDTSVESVQCLVLLSIYHCCLSKPYQAYDYAMITSFKVQNLLKYVGDGDGELYEHLKRAYWAVLLLESELRIHFDVIGSGIWDHDGQVALPDSRRAWQFDIETGSPQSSMTTPASNISADVPGTDQTQSYFLAEIAMRRMLHRCNTAIRRTPQGEIVYAPNIALELELQLDEWYGYLPECVRFQNLEADTLASAHSPMFVEPLGNFLRVQYYCCKLSIYWPAIYQCIQDGAATSEVLEHCKRFFQAYIQLMPSLLICIRTCIANRWTLYASIFMTSMAVIQAARTPCLGAGCVVDWPQLLMCLKSTGTVDRRIVEASPSLSLLERSLAHRLTEIEPWFDEVNKVD